MSNPLCGPNGHHKEPVRTYRYRDTPGFYASAPPAERFRCPACGTIHQGPPRFIVQRERPKVPGDVTPNRTPWRVLRVGTFDYPRGRSRDLRLVAECATRAEAREFARKLSKNGGR